VYGKGIVTFDFPAASVVALVDVAISLLLYGSYRVLGGRGRGAAVDTA
jgi:2-aminoethylphosphonate transport system permease protein